MPHSLQAFPEHIATDTAEHNNISNGNEKIRIAHGLEQLDNLNTDRTTGNTADQQHDPHGNVNITKTHMGNGSRGRGTDDLIGITCCRNRRRDTKHHQKRRHEETTADTKNSRQQSDKTAQAKNKKNIHTVSRNG